MHRVVPSLLVLLLVSACGDDDPKPRDSGPGKEAGAKEAGVDTGVDSAPAEGGAGGKFEMTVNEDLLGVLEVRFLKGRCLGRLSIHSDTTAARQALVTFANAVAQPIPLDGSKPADDDELKGFVPASKAVGDWEEDLTDDPTVGPWLITTDAFDWINGGGQPFQDNGFEAAAGEHYIDNTSSWKLKLELVNQGTPDGAEKAFRSAHWDQGKAP